jgi:hypothetical protein
MNKLGRHVFVILFVVSIGCTAYGQVRRVPYYAPRPPVYRNRVVAPVPEQKVEVVKERYIYRQLALTPAQAQKFIPLYQEYQRELFNIRKLKRFNNTSAQANGPDQVNKELYYDEQILNIRRSFNNAFLKVLPAEKVSQLYKSEREFNDELVRQLSERRGN